MAVPLAVAACSGQPRAKTPLEIYRDGLELERRANDDPRTTREKLFDEALVKFDDSCAAGHLEACARRDELDRALRERRGVCDSPESCLDQGVVWLPNWRGEQRLRALCLGEAVTFDYGTPPPAWKPDGRACLAVANFYRDAKRGEPARFYYEKGCVVAGLAESCRRGGELAIDGVNALDTDGDARGKRRALRIAARKLGRGCDLEDAESCALLARVALARQRLRFPDEFSLRFTDEEADPREFLDDARAAAQRACDLGAADACDRVRAVDEQIARVEGIQKMGCAFLDDCAAGEICNRKTGLCESSKAKGAFYKSYERGINKFDARSYAAARKAFEKARSMNPSLPGPWRWLGLIASREKRYADCVQLLDEALRLNPTSRHARGMEQVRERCRASVAKK